MAKNLYNLTAVTTVNDSDLLHVNQGSVSSDKKVTKQNLLKEVNSSISSINSSLAQFNVIGGTFTINSSQTSANQYLVIRQSGHVVSVWGYVSGLNCSGSTVEIGTISGVSLPADHVRFLCNYGDNAYSTGVPSYAFVDASSGKLYLYPPSTGTGKAIYFNITWIR
jgi:hypothetical protein